MMKYVKRLWLSMIGPPVMVWELLRSIWRGEWDNVSYLLWK